MKKLFILSLLFCLPFAVVAQEQFSVYFDSNQFELKQKENDRLTQWLTANKEAKIVAINGYTDEDGTTGLNDTLAQKRVNYVFNLVKGKIKTRDDFKTRSFGELHKHSPNKAENRKVTVYYIEPKDLHRENEILGIKPVATRTGKISYPTGTVLNNPDGTKQEVTFDKDFIAKVDAAKPGEVLKLDNLNFYENTFGILPQSRPKLYELLAIMKANKFLKIKILGHICCMEGDPRDLSTKRAKAVMMFLNQNGIEKNRLSFEGRGTKNPINPLPEKDEAARAENRRVEILVMEN
jgi:outer membrane protein OmpA-like peptidoglycan-associated protein